MFVPQKPRIYCIFKERKKLKSLSHFEIKVISHPRVGHPAKQSFLKILFPIPSMQHVIIKCDIYPKQQKEHCYAFGANLGLFVNDLVKAQT